MRITLPIAALALVLAGCSPSSNTASKSDGSAVANADLWPAAASPEALTSPATEAAIDGLLKAMTLEQKVGQLIQADISAITPRDLKDYPLGSILAGGNSGPYGNERASAAKWAQLVGEFRAASQKSGAGIPILFGVDAVHGHSNLPGATIFPHNIGLGAARDDDLLRRIGQATAAEISASGIEWTFAPTLAVPQDIRWGRTYEGYSSDPALVSRYASAMTLGLQGPLVAGQPIAANQVASTAKHFLADGGTFSGRDQGDARISEAELIKKHAPSYPAAIDAGALTVMVSFSGWNGTKHHGNKSLLTDVLKGRMGFSGLVVGDWNGHGQVTGCSAGSCPAAINAGLDLLMAPDSWKKVYVSTLAAARDGTIPLARIDDAVRRILRVKYKLGLMGDTLTTRGDASAIGNAGHLAIAREAVAKSLVLLKNNGNILPVKSGANVLIAGPGADNMAMQAGGWTVTWQGKDTTAADFPNGQTIGRAISDAVKANGGTATLSPEGQYGTKPSVAIVVLGESPYAEFEGDVPHLAYQPQPADLALIARLKAQSIPVVVVFLSGRPMFTGPLINQSDAFVAAWLPGTQGNGVADLLVASPKGQQQRDFVGRLPFAWPADAIAPVTKPLFSVGYGLSYAKPATLARVNEAPGMDISSASQSTDYVVRGDVPAPWHLDMDGSITTRAVDLSAQEDARKFSWNAAGTMAINGPVVDLTKHRDAGVLVIDWRIDQLPNGPIAVSLGDANLDISAMVRAKPAGTIVKTSIALRCFSAAGTKLATVGSPFRIKAPKAFVATIRNVRIEKSGGAAKCPATASK